jgi:hypothetical protein
MSTVKATRRFMQIAQNRFQKFGNVTTESMKTTLVEPAETLIEMMDLWI